MTTNGYGGLMSGAISSSNVLIGSTVCRTANQFIPYRHQPPAGMVKLLETLVSDQFSATALKNAVIHLQRLMGPDVAATNTSEDGIEDCKDQINRICEGTKKSAATRPSMNNTNGVYSAEGLLFWGCVAANFPMSSFTWLYPAFEAIVMGCFDSQRQLHDIIYPLQLMKQVINAVKDVTNRLQYLYEHFEHVGIREKAEVDAEESLMLVYRVDKVFKICVSFCINLIPISVSYTGRSQELFLEVLSGFCNENQRCLAVDVLVNLSRTSELLLPLMPLHMKAAASEHIRAYEDLTCEHFGTSLENFSNTFVENLSAIPSTSTAFPLLGCIWEQFYNFTAAFNCCIAATCEPHQLLEYSSDQATASSQLRHHSFKALTTRASTALERPWKSGTHLKRITGLLLERCTTALQQCVELNTSPDANTSISFIDFWVSLSINFILLKHSAVESCECVFASFKGDPLQQQTDKLTKLVRSWLQTVHDLRTAADPQDQKLAAFAQIKRLLLEIACKCNGETLLKWERMFVSVGEQCGYPLSKMVFVNLLCIGCLSRHDDPRAKSLFKLYLFSLEVLILKNGLEAGEQGFFSTKAVEKKIEELESLFTLPVSQHAELLYKELCESYPRWDTALPKSLVFSSYMQWATCNHPTLRSFVARVTACLTKKCTASMAPKRDRFVIQALLGLVFRCAMNVSTFKRNAASAYFDSFRPLERYIPFFAASQPLPSTQQLRMMMIIQAILAAEDEPVQRYFINCLMYPYMGGLLNGLNAIREVAACTDPDANASNADTGFKNCNQRIREDLSCSLFHVIEILRYIPAPVWILPAIPVSAAPSNNNEHKDLRFLIGITFERFVGYAVWLNKLYEVTKQETIIENGLRHDRKDTDMYAEGTTIPLVNEEIAVASLFGKFCAVLSELRVAPVLRCFCQEIVLLFDKYLRLRKIATTSPPSLPVLYHDSLITVTTLYALKTDNAEQVQKLFRYLLKNASSFINGFPFVVAPALLFVLDAESAAFPEELLLEIARDLLKAPPLVRSTSLYFLKRYLKLQRRIDTSLLHSINADSQFDERIFRICSDYEEGLYAMLAEDTQTESFKHIVTIGIEKSPIFPSGEVCKRRAYIAFVKHLLSNAWKRLMDESSIGGATRLHREPDTLKNALEAVDSSWATTVEKERASVRQSLTKSKLSKRLTEIKRILHVMDGRDFTTSELIDRIECAHNEASKCLEELGIQHQ